MTDVNNKQVETVEQELARLRQENERLKAIALAETQPTIKISDKGAVCVYGMGRFPVSLYRKSWFKLLDMIKQGHIQTFLDQHKAELDAVDAQRDAEKLAKKQVAA